MIRYIDADKLALHLSDYALQESPNWGANGYGNQDAYDAINECIKAIDDQPTADVRENVRGEWIDCGIHGDWAWEQDGHGNSWHIWKCSKCEYKTENRSNYCPNCGAEMGGKS